MFKGIKLRIYPNKEQREQLDVMFGNSRFVWNNMLAMMNERYKNNKELPILTEYKLHALLKPLKAEYPFLKRATVLLYKWFVKIMSSVEELL